MRSRLIDVLLIDDDLALGSLLEEYAREDGMRFVACSTGEDGLDLLRARGWALVVLDVMLPGIDGFTVLERLRNFSNVPVLMLTTKGATADRVRGLLVGADDYLPKPFEPAELIARLKSIWRRVRPRAKGMNFLLIDDLELDAERRLVVRGGDPVELTGSEFSLLRLLLSNAGEVMEREALIQLVLEREINGIDRSIDNLVGNLRRKLGPSLTGTDRIQSVRGIGYVYRFATPRSRHEYLHP